MLENMFIGDPPGNYDRILDFSTAVTGSLFFVPTADFLDNLPPAPGDVGQPPAAGPESDAGAESASVAPVAEVDGSLGIAGLKGSTLGPHRARVGPGRRAEGTQASLTTSFTFSPACFRFADP